MNILKIKPLNKEILELYINHSTFHEGDSGLDLFIPETVTIPAGKTIKVSHLIQCEMIIRMPNMPLSGGFSVGARYTMSEYNETFLLLPRSSISNTPLILHNGTGIIDAGYRGEIIAAIRNLSNEDYQIEKGTRLFQICAKDFNPFKFEIHEKLSETTRGEGGFGSTGK